MNVSLQGKKLEFNKKQESSSYEAKTNYFHPSNYALFQVISRITSIRIIVHIDKDTQLLALSLYYIHDSQGVRLNQGENNLILINEHLKRLEEKRNRNGMY